MKRVVPQRNLDWVVRRLRALDQFALSVSPDEPVIQLRPPGGQALDFEVKLDRRISEERARGYAELAQRNEPASERVIGFNRGASRRRRTETRYPLIATDRLTETARAVFREARISWVEEMTAVVHLIAPGLLIDIDPSRPQLFDGRVDTPNTGQRPARLRGQSGICAEVLLLAFRRSFEAGSSIPMQFQARDVASEAELSGALVSRVLTRLARDGIVSETSRAPRLKKWILSDAGALLDRWAQEENGPELVTDVYAYANRPAALRDKIKALTEKQIDYAVGGVIAADMWAAHLSKEPPIVDLWISARESVDDVARMLEGTVLNKGERGANVRLWQSKGDPALRKKGSVSSDLSSSLAAVSWARAYVEAYRASGRGREVADNLRRRWLPV
jgi:hypothetical protein